MMNSTGSCAAAAHGRARAKGALPRWKPRQRALPSGLLRRAFGPLDTHTGIPTRGFSLAGVTARDGRAATLNLQLAAAAAKRVPRLRTRADGFAIALCTPSQHPNGCLGRKSATLSPVAFTTPSIRQEGRRFPKGDASPVASPLKAEVESGATMTAKPFGERGFRRRWRQ